MERTNNHQKYFMETQLSIPTRNSDAGEFVAEAVLVATAADETDMVANSRRAILLLPLTNPLRSLPFRNFSPYPTNDSWGSIG